MTSVAPRQGVCAVRRGATPRPPVGPASAHRSPRLQALPTAQRPGQVAPLARGPLTVAAIVARSTTIAHFERAAPLLDGEGEGDGDLPVSSTIDVIILAVVPYLVGVARTSSRRSFSRRGGSVTRWHSSRRRQKMPSGQSYGRAPSIAMIHSLSSAMSSPSVDETPA